MISILRSLGQVHAAMGLMLLAGGVFHARAAAQTVAEVVDVECVWSAHPVGFSLLTHKKQQFVAYYDAERQMKVAFRKLGQTKWTFHKLGRKTGWDSHNYVTMAIDSADQIHLSGDMHCVPLFYMRTTRPLDPTSLERVANMVGPQRERRVTYPIFIRGAGGEIVFRYRDGGSGNGDDLYNVYDPRARKWRRLIETPLTSGQGKMNAYCTRPTLGPDGLFHMVWVWRDTPDAATNHHLSYARSRDLVRWETSAGKPLKLPITIGNADIIDPVPARGGMINGNTKIGFDSRKRLVVTYHKFDAAGNTQVYTARLEDGKWRIYQTSDWKDYRWNFGGRGAIPFEVRVGGVRVIGPGRLALWYKNKNGSGTWVLDEKTLKPIKGETPPKEPRKGLPAEMLKVESKFPGMSKRVAGDLSPDKEPGVRYVMTWETLEAHRDRAREGDLPKPSMLRVIKIVSPAKTAGKGKRIFDGKTFKGWEGNLKWFRIEDGAIVGGTLKKRIPNNEFLCTTKDYADFEMRLKVKLLGKGANAGIQIRSRRIPNHHEVRGYQADMGQGWWGCLYDESRRNKVLARADRKKLAKVLKTGEWNDYVIRCEGKRVQLWINGYQTVDYTEPDEKIEQTGIIGLQIHGGGPSEAWYKDIDIIKLP